MRVIILGSAAGGGLPQWNCGCSNCQEARLSGTGRTQSSVALSADGARWVLLNASPDLRAQVASRPELWPRGARGTAISAVVRTDGEIDHTLGLLLLREAATRFPLYASAGVVALLDGEWPVLRVLSAYAGVEPRVLPEGEAITLGDGVGRELGIACTAVSVARRPPRYATQATAATYGVAPRGSGPRWRGPGSRWQRTVWRSSCDGGDVANRSGRRRLVARRIRAPAPQRAGASLSPPPPLQPPDARGRAVPRRAAALGRQSLLLSSQHPDQGRPDPLQLSRAGRPPHLDPADHRPRRPPRGRGRDRGVAAPRPRNGREPGRPAGAAPAPPGRSLRGGRLRELLSLAAVARSGRRVAH